MLWFLMLLLKRSIYNVNRIRQHNWNSDLHEQNVSERLRSVRGHDKVIHNLHVNAVSVRNSEVLSFIHTIPMKISS